MSFRVWRATFTDRFQVQVVLFAVPGAFTPTCSLKHLPGFIEQAHELKVLCSPVFPLALPGVFTAVKPDAVSVST